jgi:EmrB/QacA subfamily drug resistance transporter
MRAGRPRSPGQVLATALFGLFVANVNVSVLAVVIPELVHEFHTSKTVIAWMITGPTLAFAVLGPTAGKLGDLYGRRRIYLVGLAGTALFAALAAAAQSPAQLIGFRTAAAIFATSTGPAGMAIISTQFSRERRVQALGYWGLVAAGGPVLGLVIGGVVADAFGWRWLFIPQVPLALVGLVLAAVVLPEARVADKVRFDVLGSVLLGLAVGSLLFAVNRAPTWGWSSPVVVACLLLSPLAGLAFALCEWRRPYALIPLEYFRRRNFASPMAAQLLVNFTYQGGVILMPLMLAEVLGLSSAGISLLVLARPGFYALCGPASAWLAVRTGERRVAVTGALAVAVSSALLATVGADTNELAIFGFLALAGAGLGTMVPSLTSTITTAVDDRDLGVAGATSQMMLQIGTVLGVQCLQTLQLSHVSSGVVASYRLTFLVAAAVAVAGAAAASLVRSMDRSAIVSSEPAMEAAVAEPRR